MKTFLVKFSACLMSFFFMICLVYYSNLYTYLLPNRGVYKALTDSKKKNNKARALIIGDSVGGQLFDPMNNDSSSVVSLACNQAIDLVGHYILLANSLQENEQIEKVYFVYNPFSFRNNLDHEFTYNYFLKPFNIPEYRNLFTPNTLKQIESVPFHKFSNLPPVAITFWTPEIKKETETQVFMSQISSEYLQKMINLTSSKGIEFKVISPPIRTSRKKEVEHLYRVAMAEKTTERFSQLFDNYFKDMLFLPDAEYIDPIHLNYPQKHVAIMLETYFDADKQIAVSN
ncbi:hypothetical protein [Pontibacter harenae]|uniref:hypothetical protein n=1 Tax=Pontibacter harenae TaxID=2894083 RepID=UPI001E2D2922|nr:hypothetical protein [Pontibacter harenae]MCC9165728.1 hypothetical protein [Pontibacter harenae]